MPTLDELRELDESEFTQRAIIPLLREMGYKNVKNVHGGSEHGKDVIFYRNDGFGNKIWKCVQAKAVQVHGSMIRGGNYTEVKNQIEAASTVAYTDSRSGDEVYINLVYIITSEDFTQNAKDGLVDEFADEPVHLIDGEDILAKLEEHNVPITDEELFKDTVQDAEKDLEFPIEVSTENGVITIPEPETIEEGEE